MGFPPEPPPYEPLPDERMDDAERSWLLSGAESALRDVLDLVRDLRQRVADLEAWREDEPWHNAD